MNVLEMDSIAAMYLAHDQHAGQLDYDGDDHYRHLARVAEMVPDDCQRVAWLHDVVEDTDITLPDLEAKGLPLLDLDAIAFLTRVEDETYDAYIGRLVVAVGEAGAIARLVKEADLIDNLARCLRARDDKSKSLAHRYRAALPRIQQAMVGR